MKYVYACMGSRTPQSSKSLTITTPQDVDFDLAESLVTLELRFFGAQ